MSANAPTINQVVDAAVANALAKFEAERSLNDVKNIVGYLRQFTKWRFKTPVDPDDYRWATVQMKQTVTTGNAAGVPTTSYRAPANFHMLVFGIEGHLAFNSLSSETLSVSNIGNPSVQDRLLIKAMNARLAFTNTDRNGGTKIFENANLPLASVLDYLGGQPLAFEPPHVVPNGENLQLDITMSDTTAAVIGGSTDIGINIKALFVRARE